MSGYNTAEIDRRSSQLLRMGRIVEVDTATARCRVALGDLVTPPIPWPAARAGADRSWWAPSIGDQVMIGAPSGDLAQAAVLSTYYQDSAPPPADAGDTTRVVFADGSLVELVGGMLTVQATGDVLVEAAGDLTLKAGGTITLDAPNVEIAP